MVNTNNLSRSQTFSSGNVPSGRVGEQPANTELGGHQVRPDEPFDRGDALRNQNTLKRSFTLGGADQRNGKPIVERDIRQIPAAAGNAPARPQLEKTVDRNGNVYVGDFFVVGEKGSPKVLPPDFKMLMSMLASGKAGVGEFSVDPATGQLTTVNDRLLSFLNPSSNQFLRNLNATKEENVAIRETVCNSLIGEADRLDAELDKMLARLGNTEECKRAGDFLKQQLQDLKLRIRNEIAPPGDHAINTKALLKQSVQVFADRLHQLGEALEAGGKTPSDVQSFAKELNDYEKKLADYEKTLQDHPKKVADAEEKYKADCSRAQQECDRQFAAATEKYEKDLKSYKEKLAQAKTDHHAKFQEEHENWERDCQGKISKQKQEHFERRHKQWEQDRAELISKAKTEFDAKSKEVNSQWKAACSKHEAWKKECETLITNFAQKCDEKIQTAKNAVKAKYDDQMKEYGVQKEKYDLQMKDYGTLKKDYDVKIKEYETKLAEFNAARAHLDKYGTGAYEDLPAMMKNVFFWEPTGTSYVLQLDGSTKGSLSYYRYLTCLSAGNKDYNTSARQQLQATLSHALWQAGLENDERAKGWVDGLGGSPEILGSTLYYADAYPVVKNVFDLIEKEGKQPLREMPPEPQMPPEPKMPEKPQEPENPLENWSFESDPELAAYSRPELPPEPKMPPKPREMAFDETKVDFSGLEPEPTLDDPFDEGSVVLDPEPTEKEFVAPDDLHEPERPVRENVKLVLPPPPNLSVPPSPGVPPAVPGVDVAQDVNDFDSAIKALMQAQRGSKLQELNTRVDDLKVRCERLADDAKNLEIARIKTRYGVPDFIEPETLTAGDFAKSGARGSYSVTLTEEGRGISYTGWSNPPAQDNVKCRNLLMASLEYAVWHAGLSESGRMRAFLNRAAATLQIGNPGEMGKQLDYVDAYNLLHSFQLLVTAEGRSSAASAPIQPGAPEEVGAELLTTYGVKGFQSVNNLLDNVFTSSVWIERSVCLDPETGALTYSSFKTSEDDNKEARQQLMATFERDVRCSGLKNLEQFRGFLDNARLTLLGRNGEKVEKPLAYSQARTLMLNFRSAMAAARTAEIETSLRETYGVMHFQPIQALTDGDFYRGEYMSTNVVRMDTSSGKLTYARSNPDDDAKIPALENEQIRLQLVASFEREIEIAGLGDEFRAFLADVRKELLGYAPAAAQKFDPAKLQSALKADGCKSVLAKPLSYATAHKLMWNFRNKLAEATGKPFVDAPVATSFAELEAVGGKKSEALGNMGTIGVAYSMFGEQLLNPLVGGLLSGLGLKLEGFSISGDKDGNVLLHLDSLDASGLAGAEGDANGLLSKYEDVTIPIKPEWNAKTKKFSFTFKPIRCGGHGGELAAQRLNAMMNVVRQLNSVEQREALEKLTGLEFDSKAEGISFAYDLSQMNVQALGNVGLKANIMDNVGAIRFTENGVTLALGDAVRDANELPDSVAEDGMVNINADLGSLVRHIGPPVLKMLERSLGIGASEIGIEAKGAEQVLTIRVKEPSLYGYKLGDLTVKIKPQFDADLGLVTLDVLEVGLSEGKASYLLGGASRFSQTLLNLFATGYPDMLTVMGLESGETILGRLQLAIPNLMPAGFAGMGEQKIADFKVTDKGISVNVGIQRKPGAAAAPAEEIAVDENVQPPAGNPGAVNLNAPAENIAPVENNAPAEGEQPQKATAYYGTVGLSYHSFSQQIMRPILNQVASDLGIDLRGLKLSGGQNGEIRLSVKRLGLGNLLESYLGKAADSQVSQFLKSAGAADFSNLELTLQPGWNAQTGRLEFSLENMANDKNDGIRIGDFVESLRKMGVFKDLRALTGLNVEDAPGRPLKFSFDLSTVSVKELKAMGLSERLSDNLGGMRFSQGGVALDLGAERPALNERPEALAADGDAFNADVDVGTVVASNQNLIKGAMAKVGVACEDFTVTPNERDGTLTVDVTKLNCDKMLDGWTKQYKQGIWKLLKPFARVSGMSVTVKPTLGADGNLQLAVTDIRGRGFPGVLSAFFLRHGIFGLWAFDASWITGGLPTGMSKEEKAGNGEYARVSISLPNLMPGMLANFGAQKITSLKVTGRGLSVGVGTNWSEKVKANNRSVVEPLRATFAKSRRLFESLEKIKPFAKANRRVMGYLSTFGALFADEVTATDVLEFSRDYRFQRKEGQDELREGRQEMLGLLARRDELDEDVRELLADLVPANFPDLDELTASLTEVLVEE